MTDPDRYSPALALSPQGETTAGMMPDKKGGYVTAEDYFEMREIMLRKMESVALEERKNLASSMKGMRFRIEDLEKQLARERQISQDWREIALERDKE